MNEREIFDAALNLVDPVERAAYLDRACAADPALREHLVGLLQMHERLGSFLESPSPRLVATVDEQPLREGPASQIGPYKLLEQIGEGGFGVVFLAEQHQPVRRRVALKVLKPGMDSKQVIARFEAERQALALMDHPNIAKVLEAGTTDTGRPYFVMELVRGIALTDYCDQCCLTTEERLELLLSVCQAVQHAHQKGIIHRDLKPSNVLVAIQDGKPAVKVIDFGIAKAINQRLSEHTLLTGFHQMIGTPLYMSPEQAEMSPLDVDTRADIYALGVLLYELLTGTTPFEKERLSKASYDELRRILREEEPPRPSARLSTLKDKLATVATQRRSEPRQLRRTVQGELDWIVMKCLEKDRNRRYQTANSLAADLERYLHDEPVQACPPSVNYRLRKFVRRHKGPALAAALVFVALVAGIVGTTWQAVRATQAEGQARHAQGRAEANLRKAHQAVHDYFTLVSESTPLLDEPALEPLRKRLLQAALGYYQEFVQEHQNDPELQAELAATYFRISILTFEMGPEKDWLPPYQTAVAILEDLLRQKPASSALESLTGVNYGNAVRLFHVRDLQEALRTFEKARPLWEELVRLDPRAPGFRNSLAVIHLGIAVLHEGVAVPPAERVGSTQKAVELWQQLIREEQDNSRYRAALATSFRVLGLQCAAAGEFSRATEAMQQARQTAEKLAADDPSVPGHQELLHGIVPEGIGFVEESAGRLERAEAAYREMLAGHQTLSQKYSTVQRYQAGMFWARLWLGLVLWARGARAFAAEEFRQLRQLGEQLSPDDPEIQDRLAWILATCPDPRFRDPTRAVQLAEPTVQLVPQHGGRWTTLGAAYYAAGDYQAATGALESAVKLDNYWETSSAHFLLAMTRAQLGQPEEARRCYQAGLARMEQYEQPVIDSLRIRDEAAKVLGIEDQKRE